jgi:hypothetical protein
LPVDRLQVRFARGNSSTSAVNWPVSAAGGGEMPDEEQPGPESPEGERPSEGPTGRMRFQDESTRPREPTLAERRAREQAARRAEEEERRALEEQERSRKKRKRILVGTGVTVGVVALIAVGYAAAQPEDEVVAQCVDEQTNVVVDDANCVTPTSASGGYYGGGFYPIFIGGGGRQYRYNYGGAGTIGQPVQGGTATVPREGTRVTTSSGRTVAGQSGSSSVSRGGLGVSGGSSSSGS